MKTKVKISEDVLKLKIERLQQILPMLMKLTRTKNTDIAEVCDLSVDVISNIKNNRSRLKQKNHYYELLKWFKHTIHLHPNLPFLSIIYDSFSDECSTIKHERLWGLFSKTMLNAFNEGADFEKITSDILDKETIKKTFELSNDKDIYLKRLLEQNSCASDYSISELPNILNELSLFCNNIEKNHINYFFKKLYFFLYQVWEMSYDEINSYTVADIPAIAIELSRQPRFHPPRNTINSIIFDDETYSYSFFGLKLPLIDEEYYTVIKVLGLVFYDIEIWIKNNITNRFEFLDNRENDETITFTKADGSSYTNVDEA